MDDYEAIVERGWRRKGPLNKRSQGTSALGRTNFKRRLFILFDDALCYYEGTDLVSSITLIHCLNHTTTIQIQRESVFISSTQESWISNGEGRCSSHCA